MLEQQLSRIADALETIAGLLGCKERSVTLSTGKTETPEISATPTVAKRGRPRPNPVAPEKITETPVVESPAKPVLVTKDDLLNKLREFVMSRGQEKAKAILLEFGAGRVSEVSEDKYEALFAKLSGGLQG